MGNFQRKIFEGKKKTLAQAVLDLCPGPAPPIYLREFWEHSQTIWGGFSTNLEKIFLCVRNFCRPLETPLWGQRGF